MPVKSRSHALVHRPAATFAPKIYYIHPLLAGPLGSWQQHLRRVQGMGFDTVLTAPLFAPGASGDLFLAGDHEGAIPVMGSPLPADQAVAELAEACRRENLQLFMDVVLGRVAPDARLAASAPEWFQAVASTQQRVDPRGSLTHPTPLTRALMTRPQPHYWPNGGLSAFAD